MFRHHPDGVIYINDNAIPLAMFLLDEPTYALPSGMIGREYVPGVRHILYDGRSQFAGQDPWPYGDMYIARLPVYLARISAPATVDAAVSTKLSALRVACDMELAIIKDSYPESEVSTWDKQEAEARAFVANPDAPTPLLAALAAARGIAVSDLAARVVAKAGAFAAAAGSIIGHRQALEDQVVAIVDNASLSDEEKRAAINLIAW